MRVLDEDSSTSSLDDSTSAGESTSEKVEVASLLRSSVGLSENAQLQKSRRISIGPSSTWHGGWFAVLLDGFLALFGHCGLLGSRINRELDLDLLGEGFRERRWGGRRDINAGSCLGGLVNLGVSLQVICRLGLHYIQ